MRRHKAFALASVCDTLSPVFLPGATQLGAPGSSAWNHQMMDRCQSYSINFNLRRYSAELRDMFLAKRHRAVILVPWFEWAELRGRGDKKHYVAEKLRGAGVNVPSTA